MKCGIERKVLSVESLKGMSLRLMSEISQSLVISIRSRHQIVSV